MKLEFKEQDDDIEVDMSPMIDMVFLLLIFFIVASQVIDPKPSVEIPMAQHAKVTEDTTGRLMITVTKDETYFVRNNQVSLEELHQELESEIEVNPDLRVLIRADGDTKYKVNKKVVEICAAVGADDLIYSVFEK